MVVLLCLLPLSSNSTHAIDSLHTSSPLSEYWLRQTHHMTSLPGTNVMHGRTTAHHAGCWQPPCASFTVILLDTDLAQPTVSSHQHMSAHAMQADVRGPSHH